MKKKFEFQGIIFHKVPKSEMKILFLILLLVYSNQAFANCDDDKRQVTD